MKEKVIELLISESEEDVNLGISIYNKHNDLILNKEDMVYIIKNRKTNDLLIYTKLRATTPSVLLAGLIDVLNEKYDEGNNNETPKIG